MVKQFLHEGKNYTFTIRRSKKSRRLRISVLPKLGVVVSLPQFAPEFLAEKFVKLKATWIVKALEKVKKYENLPQIKSSRKDYLANRHKALELAKNKVGQWNSFYGFKYNRVTIKNQKTRWGSCSKKGNLNFNYRIVHLPENLVDYLVVHELCHLKEMNHSKRFWGLVGQVIEDYKSARKQLLKLANY